VRNRNFVIARLLRTLPLRNKAGALGKPFALAQRAKGVAPLRIYCAKHTGATCRIQGTSRDLRTRD
jgi:hypothetical protein